MAVVGLAVEHLIERYREEGGDFEACIRVQVYN